MGRELKRVSMHFDWPIGKIWAGYINPYSDGAKRCAVCDGTGASPEAKLLQDTWYGYVPFKPEDRGSVPFLPTDKCVITRAMQNQQCNNPTSPGVIQESKRLCAIFNSCWMHHVNADDVAALVEAGRLYDFTRIWTKGEGWKPKNPPYIPTPREVNEWSLVGLGHDSLNQWVVCKAECERLGVESMCPTCHGHGEIWHSNAAKALYEKWKRVEPPKGRGYQIWEAVSEGSPVSPVFATPEELAQWMTDNPDSIHRGTTYESWLAFINGPGWAPSFIYDSTGFHNGVEGVATE